MKASWLALLATPLATGCMIFFPVPDTGKGCQGESAQFYSALDVIRVRAANDLDCPIQRVRIRARNDTSFSTSGCGQREEYTCEADAVSGCSLEDAAERESCSPVED